MKESTIESVNFIPAPGILLVDPIKKTDKSDYISVADSVDDPHMGYVVAVGEPKPYEYQPQEKMPSPAKRGDLVRYSIQGIEPVKLEYKGNLRYEFVVVPFTRVLGIIGKQK